MFQCLRCKCDIDDLVNFDTLTELYITCPNCDLKMEVNYDEVYEPPDDEYGWFWVEEYNIED